MAGVLYYLRLEFLFIFREKATCIFHLPEVVAAYSVLVKHVKLCIDVIEEVRIFFFYLFDTRVKQKHNNNKNIKKTPTTLLYIMGR